MKSVETTLDQCLDTGLLVLMMYSSENDYEKYNLGRFIGAQITA
jgi:hypothetical protein